MPDGRHQFGSVEVRADERVLLVDGQRSPIGARAFDLLLALIERRERVVSKDELLDVVWPGLVVEENNLQTQVSTLRKILGRQAIATVAGRGYRFTLPSAEDVAKRAFETALGADGGATTRTSSAAAAERFSAFNEIDLSLPDKPSIAVLPFSNMGGDPEQEYFTDGVTEDVITELSRFKSLFVIARDSSFVYKGKHVDSKQIGRELGVRYLLEGSIRRYGSRIRVTGQLIDSLTGNHIWAEKYDRVLEDVFAVQEEVTQAIVGAIAPQIEGAELTKVTRRRPGNMSAYEMALRAWAHAMEAGSTTDRAVAEKAIREAEEVLAIDPNSTVALMALAWAHGCLLYFQIASDPKHSLREAALAAERAVELDRSDASALALKAMTGLLAGQVEEYLEILADARRAHDLNPNDAFVLLMLTHVEAFGGESEQAIDHGMQILRLDPRTSRLPLVFNILAMACFGAKRYEDGVRWALRAIHELPRMPLPHSSLASCYVGTGEIDKAKATFDNLCQVAPIYAESRLKGRSAHWNAANRKRHLTFIRIAAGLEDPSAADTLR